MWDLNCCEICENEKVRMNDHQFGCISCYVASGPDWTERWLRDCIVPAHPDQNVVQFSEFLNRRDQRMKRLRGWAGTRWHGRLK